MTRVLVDVVIPCYKYAHYLEFCVNSILSQRGVDVRILIVDDCSPDNTPEVAAKLCAADKRVSYTRNEKNLGLVGTVNRGLMDWATATYTLLISADDAATPGALARAVSVMERFPEVGMAYGKAMIVAETSEMAGVPDANEFEYQVISGSEFLEQCCINWCGVASPAALVRTSVHHLVGGFDPDFPHTCDMDAWMRLATRSAVAALATTQAYYRRHRENMSIPYTNGPLTDLKMQLHTAAKVLTTWGKDLPGAEQWLAGMRQRMVNQAFWMAGLCLEQGNDAGLGECLAFATQNSPALWRSKGWMRFQVKRLVGRKLILAMRRQLKLREALPYSPFVHGQAFGWMPEFGIRGAMSV